MKRAVARMTAVVGVPPEWQGSQREAGARGNVQ